MKRQIILCVFRALLKHIEINIYRKMHKNTKSTKNLTNLFLQIQTVNSFKKI